MKLAIDLFSPELLGDVALDMTKEIIERCEKKGKNKYKNDREREYSLTKSQIRKFYSEFKLIEKKLPANGKIPDELYGKIKLLKAKAIYNKSRKNSALPEPFVEFIEFCVDSIKYEDNGNRQTFLNICKLFEAFVGYSSAYKLIE
jgi:CRISPR type III-A-associated protein Csm2